MAVWPRSRKSQPEDAASDDDTIDLSEAGHAWWSERDELQRAWTPPKRTATTDPGRPKTQFEATYSTESLFNWASSSEPDDPTHGGNGTLLDPYAVLGLQPGASIDEVVAAHRRLAKTYHPDRQYAASPQDRTAAEQTMSRINAAYHELRARLDA